MTIIKTIILTGGGTAGHIMPNLALLPALRRYFDQIIYTGAANSSEQNLAASANLPFYHTKCIKFSRRKVFKNLAIPSQLLQGTRQARVLLAKIAPDVVFSKGGFASLPTVLACKKLRIPYVIHESDATLGLANRLVAKGAAAVLCAHKNTKIKGAQFTGNPLRQQIFIGSREVIQKKYYLNPDKKTLLFVGGSSGAAAINDCLAICVSQLCKTYNVLHICGKNYTPEARFKNYHFANFADNIEDYYCASDLIISRCGAIASTEILALGKRAIFIPLPKEASRGDQLDNAQEYEKCGYCTIMQQCDLTPKTLIDAIASTLTRDFTKFEYDRNTPEIIADLLFSKRKSVLLE